jgi:hypothetical protein
MKVLQSLGRARGQVEATFRYRRSSQNVTIDASINRNYNQTPAQIVLTNAEWNAILTAIESAANETFRITNTGAAGDQPTQSLNLLFAAAVTPVGWAWNDSWVAYVAAILEHEGSLDLYHGALGPTQSAVIALARDI